VTEPEFPRAAPAHTVLADANVLYSRGLRDYLLYTATLRVITVNWSGAILDDVAKHMVANIAGFTAQRAHYLVAKMTEAFPVAAVEPGPEEYDLLEGCPLPDEDDREVIAAAVAAGADLICTNNTAHFPQSVLAGIGLEAITPDRLFSRLFAVREDAMLQVHAMSVQRFPGATHATTIAALRRAQAPHTAALVASLTGAAADD
jgi:predicted nucleic acid-binding protein